MEDFSFAHEPDPYVLSVLKQYYTQTNGEKGGDGDYDTFCLHSKASTLRSIRNRTANCSVSDGILESLILIDEIDRRRGVPPSDAMREAFCAVAVHLTLWWLPVSWDDYFDAVRRIWGKQIGNLELSGASGLLSTGLAKWRKEIEAALWDRETAKKLLLINTLDEALRLIRVYLREASRSMNHAFRRLPGHPTADDVAYVPASAPTEENEILRANSHTQNELHSSRRQHKGVVIAGLEENQPSCTKNGSQSASEFNGLQQVPLKSVTGEVGDKVTDLLSEALDSAEMVASCSETKISHAEGIVKDSDKDIGISMANSQTRCDPSSSCRNHERPAVISAREEDWPSYRKYVSLSSPEIDKVRNMFKSSVVDLLANVDDPLPKALEVAERIVSYGVASKKLHSEGDGIMELGAGAPDETIRKDNDRMDGNLPAPSAEPSQDNGLIRKDNDRMDGNVPAPSADHTAEPSQDKGSIRKDNDRMDGNVPAPSADHTAEPSQDKGSIRKDNDRMDGNVPAPSADHTAEPSQDKGNGAFIRPNKVRRTGIMERNGTARTFEWEDSIDNSSEELDSFSNRCTLPSPRTKHVSPLHIDEPKRWGRRRKVNRWTDEEEKALTEGVQKYGNQWTRILETYKEIFRDRSSVDLKDKWRNLLRK
ncbi:hypothetical protein V6N13_084708 [Hibiscus sabdariffa]|uniref:Uncharacterized protein n=1 Tax=Hibiscus sabdariffa TaxID=183260 RepID=A0ABR2T2D7_9ROSI